MPLSLAYLPLLAIGYTAYFFLSNVVVRQTLSSLKLWRRIAADFPRIYKEVRARAGEVIRVENGRVSLSDVSELVFDVVTADAGNRFGVFPVPDTLHHMSSSEYRREDSWVQRSYIRDFSTFSRISAPIFQLILRVHLLGSIRLLRDGFSHHLQDVLKLLRVENQNMWREALRTSARVVAMRARISPTQAEGLILHWSELSDHQELGLEYSSARALVDAIVRLGLAGASWYSQYDSVTVSYLADGKSVLVVDPTLPVPVNTVITNIQRTVSARTLSSIRDLKSQDRIAKVVRLIKNGTIATTLQSRQSRIPDIKLPLDRISLEDPSRNILTVNVQGVGIWLSDLEAYRISQRRGAVGVNQRLGYQGKNRSIFAPMYTLIASSIQTSAGLVLQRGRLEVSIRNALVSLPVAALLAAIFTPKLNDNVWDVIDKAGYTWSILLLGVIVYEYSSNTIAPFSNFMRGQVVVKDTTQLASYLGMSERILQSKMLEEDDLLDLVDTEDMCLRRLITRNYLGMEWSQGTTRPVLEIGRRYSVGDLRHDIKVWREGHLSLGQFSATLQEVNSYRLQHVGAVEAKQRYGVVGAVAFVYRASR